MSQIGKPGQQIIDLIIKCGSHDKQEALDAQMLLCKAVQRPLFQNIDCYRLTVEDLTPPYVKETVIIDIDMDINHCRDGRWDVVARLIQVFHEAIVQRMSEYDGFVDAIVVPNLDVYHRGQMELRAHISAIRKPTEEEMKNADTRV